MNTIVRSSDFDRWLSGLADQKAKARVLARLRSAMFGKFWRLRTRWRRRLRDAHSFRTRLPVIFRANGCETLCNAHRGRQVVSKAGHRTHVEYGPRSAGCYDLKPH